MDIMLEACLMLLSQQLVMVSVHISCISSTAPRADARALAAQGYFTPQCFINLFIKHTVVMMSIQTLFIF